MPFNLHDIIIITGLIEEDISYNGMEGIITSDLYIHPESNRPVHNIMLKNAHSRFALEPFNMKHKPYDGNIITSWDNCYWKPKDLKWLKKQSGS